MKLGRFRPALNSRQLAWRNETFAELDILSNGRKSGELLESTVKKILEIQDEMTREWWTESN